MVDLVVTFQRIDLNVRTFQEINFRLIQPLKITLVKITYLGQRAKIASPTDCSLLLEHYSTNAGGYYENSETIEHVAETRPP